MNNDGNTKDSRPIRGIAACIIHTLMSLLSSRSERISSAVSGFGVPRRQPGLRLARGAGAAHGAYGGILSRSGVPVRLFAERQALHQAARASGRGLRSL